MIRSAESTHGTHLPWLLSPGQCSGPGELSQGRWGVPRGALALLMCQLTPGIKSQNEWMGRNPDAGMLSDFVLLGVSETTWAAGPCIQSWCSSSALPEADPSVFPSVGFDFGLFDQAVKPLKCNGYANNNNLSWSYLLGLNSVWSWKWEQWPVGSCKERLSVWQSMLLWFWYIIKN